MSAPRAMRLGLWGFVAIVLAGGGIVFWIEWERCALPDDENLTARIAALDSKGNALAPDLVLAVVWWEVIQAKGGIASEIEAHGWGIRLLGRRASAPGGTLVRREVSADGVSDVQVTIPSRPAYSGPATLLAKPRSPMARLRFWLGAYPDDWERP